jgi:hypothetical protein
MELLYLSSVKAKCFQPYYKNQREKVKNNSRVRLEFFAGTMEGVSVVEETDSGVDEDDVVLVAGVGNLVVLGGTARTRDILDAVLKRV